MENVIEILIEVLKKDNRFLSNDGELMKNAIIQAAYSNDPILINSIHENKKLQEVFFTKLENGIEIFNSLKLNWILSNKSFLPDSYTRYSQKIGLTDDNEHFISSNNDVVIAFPYKDCILEGGMTKTEAKRDEVFLNRTLSPVVINSLLDQKVLVNAKKHTIKGIAPISTFDNKDNLIIKGNNLLAISSLLKRYEGKIKCIYLDPPYYFVADKPEDTFRYNSNFKLSSWLVFMKNRLEIAKRLLSEDGAIFVQISDDGVGELHVLMKEIFNTPTENNFINKITVKTKSPSGFASVNPGVFETAEYILAFAKNKKKWTYNKIYVESNYDDNYKMVVLNKYDSPENWMFSNISAEVAKEMGHPSKEETLKDLVKSGIDKKIAKEIFDKAIEEYAIKNAESVFRYAAIGNDAGSEVVEAREKSKIDRNKIFVVNRKNHYTVYVHNGNEIAFYSNKVKEIDGEKKPSMLLSNIWMDTPYEGISKEGGVTLKGGKKPEKLIKRIIEMSTKEGDLVLDFFLGSGTTCAVAHKMNRRYIGVDQLDYGENDSITRLNAVLKGEQSGISKSVKWQGGGSFISCDLCVLNQRYIDMIGRKDLDEIFESVINSPFVSSRIIPGTIKENMDEFKELSSDDKKRLILEILDMNMLYLNYSDIDDSEFTISQSDREFNRAFYGDNNAE